ncbi:MAG: hypothetical protein H6742_20990 [Alphaproteobacteria bacterium]|nr:hypothetical protein [Alphaproteobacteria bacterium]
MRPHPAGLPRLFPDDAEPPDARPALLSVVALMIVLVPMVLLTSTGEKATGLALGLPGPGEDLPPELPGPVESLRVQRVEAGFLVTAGVRRTDVLASAGDLEQQELLAPDLPALQAHLASLKALDPARQRLTLAPAPTSTAEQVVTWMDAVRAGPQGELYPQVVLEAAQVGPASDAVPAPAPPGEDAP